MMTTHQNRGRSPSKADIGADAAAGCDTFGREILSAGTPISFAASRRASELRPRDKSHRTDSGATRAIISEVMIGKAPVAATPLQPIIGSMFAAMIAATSVPSATGTTRMLETKVRYLVGVISTISGPWAVTAAAIPKPTPNRNNANRIQDPSGIKLHPPAARENSRPPPQMIFLRPIV